MIYIKFYDKLLQVEEIMKTLLIIVSILIIALVLLQSSKAEGASNIISGGNDALFQNRKDMNEYFF